MAFIEECLELKKATFYSDRIVLHKKKGDITILLSEVERFCYTRPTLRNYFFCGLVGGACPGMLSILLKKPHQGKRGGYTVRIKYEDFNRLPFDYSIRVQGNLF